MSQITVAVLCLLLIGGCEQSSQVTPFANLQGSTMGTYYSVQHDQCEVAREDVDQRLYALNNALSTYQSDSEISVFNQAGQGKSFVPSRDFLVTIEAAKYVHQASSGAFDPTVGPLVDLWGFGSAKPSSEPPSRAAQEDLRGIIGIEKVRIHNGRIEKTVDGVALDLSAIAKGYAVDQLAALLKERGCANFMVDIGGEMVLSGRPDSGRAWRVGVEKPDASNLGSIQLVLHLTDLAVATSGDYRNFRVVEGRRVDHVMDPRALAPANNGVVAVSVVHAEAMFADAFATAAMVLGVEEALELAENEGFALLIMTKTGSDAPVEIHYNAAMAALTDGLGLGD